MQLAELVFVVCEGFCGPPRLPEGGWFPAATSPSRRHTPRGPRERRRLGLGPLPPGPNPVRLASGASLLTVGRYSAPTPPRDEASSTC